MELPSVVEAVAKQQVLSQFGTQVTQVPQVQSQLVVVRSDLVYPAVVHMTPAIVRMVQVVAVVETLKGLARKLVVHQVHMETTEAPRLRVVQAHSPEWVVVEQGHRVATVRVVRQRVA